MVKDCSQYSSIKKIAAALQRNDPAVQKEILRCIGTLYNQPFQNKIFLPFLLAPRDEIMKTVDESFEQAVSALFEQIKDQGKAKQNGLVEQLLFSLFKSGYHKQLGLLLQVPDATAQVSFILLKMNIYYRDYFIWQYFNNFSVRQIGIITGKQADAIKNDLWTSREYVRKWLLKIGSFSTGQLISEQQFYIFLNYFTGETAAESSVPQENLIIDDPLSVQKNFELELLFRYHIDKTILLRNVSSKTNEQYLTSQEYLDHIQQIILSGQHNNQ